MTSASESGSGVEGPDLDGDDDFDDDEFDDVDDEDDEDVDFDDDEFDDEDDEDFEDEGDEDDDEDEDEDDDEDDDLDMDDEDEEGSVDDEYEPGDVNALENAAYEAGDVNTISAPARSATGTAVTARGEMPVAVLEYLARAMADDPDAVAIRREERRGSTILRLHVAARDMGRVIGRRGRTAQAIRTLVGVAGARDGVQTVVDIADD